ncbi:unnamed protein product [Leptidea sinapis]|uniref:Ig-like domain-containing protein n=1 Tax=Leptidea sinapis TaxID=189913 RepID=A0A5E4QEH7_9NEOP|nr:unnamed protein product [Leptidea sinapis]
MTFLLLICLCAYKITQLKVPLYADPRRAAELSCHFIMDDYELHSVKLYRDLDEIFRYNPSQKSEDDVCCYQRWSLRRHITSRLVFVTQIIAEEDIININYYPPALPDRDPVITGAPRLLKPGEQALLNCTSDYSLPASVINWYIDDELQKPEPWLRTELSEPQPGGLRASSRVLRLKMPPETTGTLRVRCEAVLMVEPPVVRDTSAIVTLLSQTQLSKYVSKADINTAHAVNIAVIWTLNNFF